MNKRIVKVVEKTIPNFMTGKNKKRIQKLTRTERNKLEK